MAQILCYGKYAKTLAISIQSYDQICCGNKQFIDIQNETQLFEVESIPFSINNKYFNAELLLNVHNSNQHPLFNDNLNQSECCILTISTSSQTETSIEEELSQIGQLASELNIGVRLLVSVKNQENELFIDQHRENRIVWCLDNGFEYIEIDSSNPVHTNNLREKESLPRLIEALNSNMWSSMKKISNSSKSSSQNTNQTSVSTFNITTNNNNPEPSQLPETVFNIQSSQENHIIKENSTSQNDDINLQTDLESDETLNQILKSNLMKFPSNEKNQLKEIFNNGNSGGEEEEDDDEHLWNAFNDVISQARQMRNNSINGKLTDDERRKRAAELTMRLCAAMNFNDDSSDEDK